MIRSAIDVSPSSELFPCSCFGNALARYYQSAIAPNAKPALACGFLAAARAWSGAIAGELLAINPRRT
jgi:hypothetical protein